ncbi:flavin-containing monooxygenase [Profundibacter sp.]
MSNSTQTAGADYDAIVIGAGFGGLYTVHKLRDEQGLNVKGYDNASDVGGTWYWNRYPGALSDTESYIYRYSFDKKLLGEWTWTDRYITQPEILDYLNHVADRYDLRRSYDFDTNMTSAKFDEATNLWSVTTDKGETVTAKILVTGLGLLSAVNYPDLKGIDTFKGACVHTARWPEDLDLTGKKVGIIGTASTGQQVITSTAPIAKHLTVFQRSAQYCVPVGQRPQTDAEISDIKANWDTIWDQVRGAAVAFGFDESTIPAMSVSAEERERVFQQAWDEGGGFRFMFATFADIATDMDANKAATDFVTKKILEIVKDPETAKKLIPTDIYAKRPLCGTNYFEVYNRDNVSLVDVKADPVAQITETGVKLVSGAEHDLDVLIFATGFDAVDGNYTKIEFVGRDGVTLGDKWKGGPGGFMGVMETGFPNMFMILGPNGPFTNLPPSIETQVEWIADTVKYVNANDIAAIDVKPEAQEEWLETCRTIADMTLFPKADSWIFGANIPGKEGSVMFYLGGLGNYRQALKDVVDANYASFTLDGAKIAAE